MALRYLRWLSTASGKVGEFRIFSLSYWTEDWPDLWLADVCIVGLPFLLLYDLIAWGITSSQAAAEAREMQWQNDHADVLRIAEAEQARHAYLANLQIAEMIDDPDTREMAIVHATNRYHRRLEEIMGE